MPPAAQTHFLPKDIPQGTGSRVRWALRPTGHLLLFVHGFGGDATDTWSSFPDLLPLTPATAGWDLVFYGYPSLRARADASAGILYQFLDQVLASPATYRNRHVPLSRLPESFQYQRILIVAHSLGSIVSRLMLLRAHRALRPWTSRAELVLYAPAHMGARLLPLAEGALRDAGGSLGNATANILRARFPVFDDLVPDSPTLQTLRTEVASGLAVAPSLRARKVVFGEFENVVNTDRFPEDPDSEILPAKDHMGVCKPSRTSERSYRLLAELL